VQFVSKTNVCDATLRLDTCSQLIEIMRLSAERLNEITHLKRKSAQVAWFRQHLGVNVPCDRFGPILTDSAYEKLLEKRLGWPCSKFFRSAN